ncbi:MAG TPA: glycosyltransferase family 2 protein [Kofleriaceae bacterium]|nr:glycosyltransferase family 2 protein [Kofleriaceae bacterium]
MISVIVECWNIDSDTQGLARLLDRLEPEVDALDAEVVVTHGGISAADRDMLAAQLGRPITWLELPATAGYYEHKNRGFDASTGDIVVFIDGDCEPSATWLASIVAPFLAGARVVAGATSYAGALAPLANELDFPYFDGADKRRRFAATSAWTAPTVRNFFANNVAFAREAFASRRYPSLPMFHGQCQVLALRFVEAGIPIVFAARARVTHAWPGSVSEWLQVRLLRGADTTQLLPHVLATYAPEVRPAAVRLGPLPALAVLALRAVTGSLSALRRGPIVRGLALVAGVTVVDALGAAIAPAVYRWIA